MPLAEGLHDVPPGHLAAVVTRLERRRPPAPRAPMPSVPPVPWRLVRAQDPDPAWYRALFRRVGADWLWTSRLRLDDVALRNVVQAPGVEVHTLQLEGADMGLLELDRRVEGLVEIAFFGLVPELTGQGAGRWLMDRALELAFSRPIRMVWLHTCTLDSPAALPFYRRAGFTPVARRVEVFPDPRLLGLIDPDRAPNVPVLDCARPDPGVGAG